MSGLAEGILAAAALVGALGVLWRALRVGELRRGTLAFLRDWNGEPGRPGVEARPSFPERMAVVEQRTRDLNHMLRGDTTSRLVLLSDGMDHLRQRAAANRAGIDRLEEQVARLDQRVTSHADRNAEQVRLLREEVDRRFRTVSGDLLRAETYRAALVELGLDLDPAPPDPEEHDT